MAGSKDNLVKFSKNDQESLEHLSNLLHLFHHRNKNQHRRSIWWRHFLIFRRQVNGLIDEVHHLNEIPSTHLERARRKAKDKATQTKISQRLELWQTVLVPKWQHSFSQLVADGRFAVLGLVLTAALAQSCKITGIIGRFDDLGQAEIEKVLEEFGKQNLEELSKREDVQHDDSEDLGVVVARDAGEGDDSNDRVETIFRSTEHDGDASESRSKSRIITAKPAKKKRKRGDAIDDLFSSLG